MQLSGEVYQYAIIRGFYLACQQTIHYSVVVWSRMEDPKGALQATLYGPSADNKVS
jgi:hypothetical protein